jgi:hypothetical protein
MTPSGKLMLRFLWLSSPYVPVLIFLFYLTLSLANCTTTRTLGSLSAYR